jgi:hypothetical protein
MTNEEFIILAEKVAEGSAGISEIALYNASYESFQQDPQSLTADGLDSKELKKESLARFWKNNNHSKPVVKLWPRIAVVAAAVAAIVLGVYFFNASRHANTPRHPELVSGSQDIAPGKNGATITLANGKIIQLSDKKLGVVIGKDDLKYSDGSFLSPSGRDGVAREGSGSNNPLSPQGGSLPEGERSMMLTASTAKGQTYQFTLPDGTKVWLNADSKISFPSQFSGKERKILLDGEGYFEVVHNAKQPFRVESKGQVVEDIGTAFNINAYKDEASVRTTLVEGEARVHLTGISDKPFRTLLTGQQSVLTGSNRITVKQVDVNESIGWKDGDFVCRNDDFKTLMRKVARWYNVEIIYDKSAPSDLSLLGEISRSKNISAILNIMEATGDVHFKIEGRRVIVTK